MIRFLLLSCLFALVMPASSQTFVVNQGNFSDGNGSVTVLPTETNGLATQLFEGQLGSILQSATQIGDKLYLVSNSANRIDVVDVQTQARVGQIGGGDTSPFSSPRYLMDVTQDPDSVRTYVTNQVYFGGASSYVLPLTLSRRNDGFRAGTPIEVDGLPEAMAVLGDSLYVALGTFGPGSGVDSLAIVDTRLNELVGYIDIGCYARFVVTYPPEEDTVLAFCEDTDEMVEVNTRDRSVRQRVAFGENIGDPSGIGQSVGLVAPEIAIRRASPMSYAFYVITESGIAEVWRKANGYEIERTIPIPDMAARSVSAVFGAPNASERQLILGRPDPDNPFSSDGTITVHDADDGTLLATYPAGIYPVEVTFDDFFVVSAEQEAAARALNLELAGPNPARGASALAFTLRQPEDARVTVHDLLGRTVATVADRAFGAGNQRVELDVSGLVPGPYRVRLSVGDRVASLPLTVIR